MFDFILSWLILIPFIGILIILGIPKTQVNAIKKEMEKKGITLDKIDKIIIDAKANARKQNDNNCIKMSKW